MLTSVQSVSRGLISRARALVGDSSPVGGQCCQGECRVRMVGREAARAERGSWLWVRESPPRLSLVWKVLVVSTRRTRRISK